MFDPSRWPTFIPLSWTPAPWQAVALSALIVIWLAIECLFRAGVRVNRALDGHSNPVIVVSSLLNFAGALLLAGVGLGRWHGDVVWVATVGLLVAAAGMGLRFWAVRTLGRFFTSHVMILADHQLVQTGPFHLLRHPSYTGGLLFGFGMALGLANWAALLLFAATHVPAILYRVRIEEIALDRHFGETYRTYRLRTAALVPYVF